MTKKASPRKAGKPGKVPDEKTCASPRQSTAVLKERSDVRHIARFAEAFPEAESVGAVLRQLFNLESVMIRKTERFLLKPGTGFTFVEHQKRITVDGNDHYIDLLFFHRRMRRLIAVELEIGEFKPADAGQVELHLRWLDQHERQSSEKAPLGIVLRAGNNRETVECLELDTRGIHVTEYPAELPPRELLLERLRRAIEAVRNRLALGPHPNAADDQRPRRDPGR